MGLITQCTAATCIIQTYTPIFLLSCVFGFYLTRTEICRTKPSRKPPLDMPFLHAENPPNNPRRGCVTHRFLMVSRRYTGEGAHDTGVMGTGSVGSEQPHPGAPQHPPSSVGRRWGLWDTGPGLSYPKITHRH